MTMFVVESVDTQINSQGYGSINYTECIPDYVYVYTYNSVCQNVSLFTCLGLGTGATIGHMAVFVVKSIDTQINGQVYESINNTE